MSALTQAATKSSIPNLEAGLKNADVLEVYNPFSISTAIGLQLQTFFTSKDWKQSINLFDHEGFWKDQIGFHWEFKTVQGHTNLLNFLNQNKERVSSMHNFSIEKDTAQFTKGVGNDQLIISFFTFQTDVGRGRGVLRLRQSKDRSWKIFALYTTLEEIKDHPALEGQNRAQGVEHGQHIGRTSWKARRREQIEYMQHSPDVLIVGAGQAGLCASARLKHLGVDALMIDTNSRIGDNWRKRYEFLVLHDPVWYDHLPYIPFPASHPVYTPKDKLADWFEMYASALELNHWMETNIVPNGVSWQEFSKSWKVVLNRGGKEERVLYPKHIIMATGHSGEPNIPTIPGSDHFRGTVVHSSQHTTGGAFKGKKAVVVGCCNSGHDIAQDFYEQGADVTIVQRSSTYVMSSDSINDILFKGLYCEGGPKTEDADLLFKSTPNAVHHEMHKEVTAQIADYDRELLSGLKKAGFNVDMGYDGSGFLMKYYRRGGGYYLDVGASQLIIDGKIKMKQGRQIDHLETDGLVFDDGSKLTADIIVLATGYLNMKSTATKIFGSRVSDRLKEAWGLDEDNELNAMYRPSGHPHFWYMGGNLAHCRSYSLPLALQIKANLLGIYE